MTFDTTDNMELAQREPTAGLPGSWGWGPGCYLMDAGGAVLRGDPEHPSGCWAVSRRHAIMAAHTIPPTPISSIAQRNRVVMRVESVTYVGNDLAVLTLAPGQVFTEWVPLYVAPTPYPKPDGQVVVPGNLVLLTQGVGGTNEPGKEDAAPMYRWAEWSEATITGFKAGATKEMAMKGDETVGPNLTLKFPSKNGATGLRIMDSSSAAFFKDASGKWAMVGCVMAGGMGFGIIPIAGDALANLNGQLAREVMAAGGFAGPVPSTIAGEVTRFAVDAVWAGSEGRMVASADPMHVRDGDQLEIVAVPRVRPPGWIPAADDGDVKWTFTHTVGTGRLETVKLERNLAVVKAVGESSTWVWCTHTSASGFTTTFVPVVIQVQPRPFARAAIDMPPVQTPPPPVQTPPPPVQTPPPPVQTPEPPVQTPPPLPVQDQVAESSGEDVGGGGAPPANRRDTEPRRIIYAMLETHAVINEVMVKHAAEMEAEVARRVANRMMGN